MITSNWPEWIVTRSDEVFGHTGRVILEEHIVIPDLEVCGPEWQALTDAGFEVHTGAYS